MIFNTRRANHFIKTITLEDTLRYLEYWKDLTPKNEWEYYWRWIFAFASIHTTWQKNVECFQAFKALPANFTKRQLAKAIKSSGVGLHKMRTEGIWYFHQRFWHNPTTWYPIDDETLVECRDRLASRTFGIGLAKTSFVLEMAFPAYCPVVCLDTHILQLYNYGRKDAPNKRTYHELERHWIQTCAEYDVPSPIARHIYWDRIQGQQDTRYWSHVLERTEEENRAAQFAACG